MVEIKNIEVFNLERAQRAIENSFNVGEINTTKGSVKESLARSLGNNMQCKESHDAWLKGILTTFDMKGNGVFMPEFQRYHFAEIIMSQSTMHSMEKFMNTDYDPFSKYVSEETKNQIRKLYIEWKEAKKSKTPVQIYEAFERLVHNLPRGFELWCTINSNYLQLKTIVIQRAKHRNQEDWGAFVEACYSMPKFRELCGLTGSEWNLENIFPLYHFYK